MSIRRDGPIVVSPEPPLDVQKALENLAGDQQLLRDVLVSFVDHLPKMLGALETAAECPDPSRIEAVSHSLKGATANICAEPVRRRAQGLEELARAGNLKDVGTAATGLAHEIGRLKDYIEELMPTLTGADAAPDSGHAATEDENPAAAQPARTPLKVLNLEESHTSNRILVVDDNPTIIAGLDDPLRVLVVDDDPTICALCKTILERKGYEVVEALDGVSAFAAIAARQPDVIIMDVMMPGMSGLECTKRLREDPATCEIPIIIVSARAKEEDILAGLKAGANEYITKPYRAAELELRVRTMAKLNRARLELAQRNEEIAKSNEARGEQAHALGILFDLSCGLAGATSPGAVLQQTVVAAAQLLQCRRISVMLPDDRGAYLTIAESIGIDEPLAANIRIPVGGAIAGQVFRSGRAIVANSAEEEAGSGKRYDSDFFISAPLVSAALRAADKVIGVLNVTNRVDAHSFTERDLEYLDLLCNLAGSTISELRSRSSREAALDSTVIALAALAEHRDSDTGRHLDRVTQYALILARDLAVTGHDDGSIDNDFLDALKRAMPLHDIGKVAVPDAILLKPAKLTISEMDTMKRHAEQGARVIRTMIERAPDVAFLRMAEEIAFGHHEWYDGTGYPRGVAGDNIPFVARMAAVADVYDALTTERVYKGPFPHDHSVEIIKNECGTHFDPTIVDAFLRCERDFADLAHELKDQADTEGVNARERLQAVATT